MSVTSCVEIAPNRSGSLDFSQGRNYTRRFRLTTDADTDGPLTVLLHHELPALGSYYSTGYESDSLAFLRKLDPQQSTDDPRVWHVDAHYSSSTDWLQSQPGSLDMAGGGSGTPGQGAASPQSRPANPLNRPVVWSFDFVDDPVAKTTDKDGDEVVNSAGRYYSPPVMIDRQLGQIVAVKNYASFSYDTAAGLLNKINSDVWHGLAIKTVRIKGVSVRSMFENDQSFVQVTFTFLHDPDGWNPTRLLDYGPYYLAGGKVQRFVDKAGQPLEFGNLDGAGGKLVPPAVAVYNLFNFYTETSFANIPPAS